MASQFDDSDFIDREFQDSQSPFAATPGKSGAATFRPPTRAELDTRVGAAQQKLAELRRAQEELERERAALEEARRRRIEFQTGREEMLQSLTRGVALMEQAEFKARRDSEQMGKTLTSLREALGAVQGIQEDTWTEENWNVELTKALSAIENARLEWNKARLHWTLLDGQADPQAQPAVAGPAPLALRDYSFRELCKLGFALTWPVALVGLIGFIILALVRQW